MPRKPRIHFNGALYHVIVRGNNQEDILASSKDKRTYLSLVEKYKAKYGFRLYAFAVMSNHAHLLIQVGPVPLGKIMQGIQQTYTQYYNRKNHRIGHVFHQRYKAILCDQDLYLLELIRYIHNNPLKAGLPAATGYQWTSHGYYVNPGLGSLVDVDFPLSLFGNNQEQAVKQYLQFMQAGDGLPESAEFRLILGEEEFINRAHEQQEQVSQHRDYQAKDAVLQSVVALTGLSAEELLTSSKQRRIARARHLLVHLLAQKAGMTNQEIAEYLQLDPSTICKLLKQPYDINRVCQAIEAGTTSQDMFVNIRPLRENQRG